MMYQSEKIFFISPYRIKFNTIGLSFHDPGGNSKNINGDWDNLYTGIESLDDFLYSAGLRMENGISWNKSPYFKKVYDMVFKEKMVWGCQTKDQLDKLLYHLEILYKRVKERGNIRGYLFDYILVNIGRHGDIIPNDRWPEIFLAFILGIKEIPVKINVRHPLWKEFKNKIIEYARTEEDGVVYSPLVHIDLQEIKAWAVDRFEVMTNHINPASDTVLDIGSYWGYMCGRFEEIGKKCTAVEIDERKIYFMERLKRANGHTFKTINQDIFNFVKKNNNFDIVLSLAVFHHFIKTKANYLKLVQLLQTLEMKEMFFWPHDPYEKQMKNAYYNPNPGEFVQFVLENTCLNRFKQIGYFHYRNLYHLYQ